ncbi:MAG: prohibitin family protein [Erysipelotrichaceae bacterium]|nr:prohibitin family protein [Erysipelotrichaceae bacterium]
MIRVNSVKKIAIAVMVAILLLINVLASVTVVKPGHTGVVVTMGKVEESVLQEGFHLKIPFVQKVVEIDNRIVKLEVETEAFSKDLQTVETILAVNYRIDPTKSYYIYKNIGSGYENILIIPAVNEVLKAITSRYTAEESVVNRVLISDGLVEGLNEKLNAFGLYITDVNIINYEFSEAYINAIEEKQVAQQKLLTAETEKQTAITKAQAEAETVKIKAEAEAEANKILADSLSKNVIEYKKIEKWNGELPTVTGGNGTIIDLSE